MIKNRLLVLAGLMLTLSLTAPHNVFCTAGAGAGAVSASGASAATNLEQMKSTLRSIKWIWNNIEYRDYATIPATNYDDRFGGPWGKIKQTPLPKYVDYKIAKITDNGRMEIKDVSGMNIRDCLTSLEALKSMLSKNLAEISQDQYDGVDAIYSKDKKPFTTTELIAELNNYLAVINEKIFILEPYAAAPRKYESQASAGAGAGSAEGASSRPRRELVTVEEAKKEALDILISGNGAEFTVNLIISDINRYTKADYFGRKSYEKTAWLKAFLLFCSQMHELINREIEPIDDQKDLLVEAYNNIKNMPELEAGIEMLEHILRRLGCSFSQRVKPSAQELAAATTSIENTLYEESAPEIGNKPEYSPQDLTNTLFTSNLASAIKWLEKQSNNEIAINKLRKELVKLYALRLHPYNCTITADQQAQINSAYDLLMRSIRSLRK